MRRVALLLVSSALAFDPSQNAPLDDEFEPIVVGGVKYDTTYYTDPSKPGRGDREVKRGDSATAHEAFGAEGDKHLGVPGGSDLELDLTILQIRANKGKIRDESRGAPPPKEGEEDTAHIFGEEPRWPDEL